MTITYTWEVSDLKVTDPDPSTPDAVIHATWKKIGTDENGTTGEFLGATPINTEDIDPATFVPFEELTEELVLTWVQAEIVKHPEYTSHINEKIQEQIDRKNKNVTEKRAPWLPPRHDPVTEYTSPAEVDKP